MFESATTFADTLKLLVPGFVFMKVFYLLGLRTKRSDAQWAVWSVLVAAVLNAFAEAAVPSASRLWFAFFLAVVAGALLAIAWRGTATLLPALAADQSIRAWDVVLSQRRWVQVDLLDGRTFLGYVLQAASSVDADEHLDLYIGEPQLLSGGQATPLQGVEGLLVARDQIASIAAFPPAP